MGVILAVSIVGLILFTLVAAVGPTHLKKKPALDKERVSMPLLKEAYAEINEIEKEWGIEPTPLNPPIKHRPPSEGFLLDRPRANFVSSKPSGGTPPPDIEALINSVVSVVWEAEQEMDRARAVSNKVRIFR